MDKANIENFFKEAQKVFDRAKARNREAAPDFLLFDALKVNENNLSSMFAHLLDPNETHGQGSLFLRLFLEEVGLHGKYPQELDECTVKREHETDEGRNIDIVVTFPYPGRLRMLGIENKPWASEGDEQCKDYLKYLQKNEGRENWLCYLSGNGDDPLSLRNKLQGNQCNCKTVAYRNGTKPSVQKWIERCFEQCEAEPVRRFLKQFLAAIPFFFSVRETLMEQALKEFVLENRPEFLELALCLEEIMPKIRQDLIVKFTKKIENQLNRLIKRENKHEESWVIKTTSNDPEKGMEKYILLYRKGWELTDDNDWHAVGVALDFHTKKQKPWEEVQLCVVGPGNEGSKPGQNKQYSWYYKDDFIDRLHKDLKGFEKTRGYWPKPYFKPPGKIDKNWGDWNTTKFFRQIANDEKANRIAQVMATELFKLAKTIQPHYDKVMLPRT